MVHDRDALRRVRVSAHVRDVPDVVLRRFLVRVRVEVEHALRGRRELDRSEPDLQYDTIQYNNLNVTSDTYNCKH